MDFASYITGFTDGEGCFLISFNQRAKLKTGLEVQPSFSISQHKRNRKILEDIHSYFKCGGIHFSKRDQNYKWEVRSLSDILTKIIPHFEKYQLKTKKKDDFLIFREICFLMKESKHLNAKYLSEIIDKAYIMNESGKRKYTKSKLLRILNKKMR
ncbi:MAG: endonuclease [Anaerolineaceae bacterium 4572_78]|nr:MAG: endonuclease [Anaerolineaceae bacterium 4572_78]